MADSQLAEPREADPNLTAQVRSALKWVAGARSAAQLVTWSITLLVIRILSPEDYGLIAMANVLIGLTNLLNELGLVPALIQVKEISEDLVKQVFGYILLSNLALFLAVFLVAPWFAWFFDNPALTALVRVLAFQLVIGSFGAVPMALLRRRLDFRGISLWSVMASLVGSGTSLILALRGFGVWALVAASLSIVSVETIGALILARFWVRPQIGLEGMRRLFSFGAWISGSRIASYLGQSSDDLIVGKLLGDGPLGLYAVARHVSTMPMQKVMSIFNHVAFPAFARLEGDLDQARSFFLKSISLSCLVFFPVMWGLSAVGGDFTTVVLGEKWRDATLVLQIITLTVPFQVVRYLLAPLMDALGRPDVTFRNMVTSLTIIPLAVLLGSRWGIDGVAFSLAVAHPLALALMLRRSLALVDCRWQLLLEAAGRPAASAAIMYLAVRLASSLLNNHLEPAIRLAITVAVGVVVFTIAALVVSRREFSLLRRMLRT